MASEHSESDLFPSIRSIVTHSTGSFHLFRFRLLSVTYVGLITITCDDWSVVSDLSILLQIVKHIEWTHSILECEQ